MKSIIYLLLPVVFLGCKSEPNSINLKPVDFNGDYETDISVTYEKAEGNTDRANAVNKLIERVIIQAISTDSTINDLPTALKNFDDNFKSFKADYPDSKMPKWELHVETETSYQSEEVMTLAISVYKYEGGAHGNDYIRLLNIDAITGREIHLSDLILDKPEFKRLAKTHFIKNLEQKEGNIVMEDYFFGEDFKLPANMGFGEDGFILLYNVYEVASYAMGYTEFAIPYEEAKPYLSRY